MFPCVDPAQHGGRGPVGVAHAERVRQALAGLRGGRSRARLDGGAVEGLRRRHGRGRGPGEDERVKVQSQLKRGFVYVLGNASVRGSGHLSENERG